MKAISIKQPWAWMILNAGKDIENRSWKTHYRGQVLIHAYKTPDIRAHELLRLFHNDYGIDYDFPDLKDMPHGAFCGMTEIYDCKPYLDLPREKRTWAEPGQFCWMLRKSMQFKNPVPGIGKLKLFDVSLITNVELLHVVKQLMVK